MLSRVPGAVYRRLMRARPLGPRALVLGASVIAATLGIPSAPATAQAACAFDPATGVLTVTMASNMPATILRSGEGIALDGQPCGTAPDTATVTTTDTIVVTGAGGGDAEVLTIDLSGGALAPGRTAEASATDSEIEVQVTLAETATLRVAGGTTDDAFTVGTSGINLNAAETAEDVDVTVSGTPALELLGGDGADRLSAAGSAATGDPVSDVLLDGGAGDDTFVGRAGGSTFACGEGGDTLDYSAADGVNANLANGVVAPSGTLVDFVDGCENVIGTTSDDVLVGDGGANSLLGGEGDDLLEGRQGDDELDGGPGTDTVTFSGTSKPVVVDLKAGTAEGLGADTLMAVENVEGSKKSDEIVGNGVKNRLVGGDGHDVLSGGAKGDLLEGGRGNDYLVGGRGRDTLDAGAGRDRLDGGKSKDTCIPGKDPDAWTDCETVKL